ncbi:ribose-5-phosphate isomerase A [Candidatus Roizmanbacteria bacterium]|nr:ribose-5-phosphate isomerase A [Candidatus Roizmanbacteria bacterium]
MVIIGVTPLVSRTEIFNRLKKKDASISLQELMKMNVAWHMADMIGSIQPTSLAIGSGSTSKKVVQAIGELIKTKRINHEMKAIATSRELSVLAIQVGLKNTESFDDTLRNIKSIREDQLPKKTTAFGFDGADEIKVLIDKKNKITGFYSIKGGGGAHTLEKIIAHMTAHEVFVVDESKIVSNLGETFHLPIEVIPGGVVAVKEKLLRAYPFTTVNVKKGNDKKNDFITDLGNKIGSRLAL